MTESHPTPDRPRSPIRDLRATWGDRALSSRLFAVLAFFPLLIAYAISADKALPHAIDPLTNAIQAWNVGVNGRLAIDGYHDLDIEGGFGTLVFLVRTPEGAVVSKYPPGAMLLATPLYAATRPPATTTTLVSRRGDQTAPVSLSAPVPPIWQASLTAALTTALAMLALGLTLRTLVDDRSALIATWIAGLGTTAWSIAADGLWQHGPAMMWLGIAIYSASRGRYLRSGGAMALAVITRPQTAIITSGIAVGHSIARRSPRVAIALLGLASVGVGAYLAFNLAVFDAFLVEGSNDYFADGLVTRQSNILVDFLRACFDPLRGFLIWSPFLLFVLPGLRAAWVQSPIWVRTAAASGLIYFLVQIRGNVWHGGFGHFAYRYPLEMLYAAAPLLTLAWRETRARHRWLRKPMVAACVASITAHGVVAFL